MTKVCFYKDDCLKTMESMQKNNFKVDVILTSPPYNTARNVKTQKAIETHNNRYVEYSDNMSNEDYCDWSIQLFNNFDKVLNKNGVVLYNISYGSENPNVMWLALAAILQNTNFMIADTVIWKKKSALPNNVSKNKLTRITEFVFVICRKDEFKTFNAYKKETKKSTTGQQYYENVFNFIEAPNNDGSCNLNKATYSSDLCEKLLNIYANENTIVYDPFMGTGTTAIACIRFNENNNNMICIGSEISEKQVEFSYERCESFKKENNMTAKVLTNIKTFAVILVSKRKII